MRSRHVQHGMHTPQREPRRDARLELEWRPQEEAAHRMPLLVEVVRLATGWREPERTEHAAVVAELRRGDHTVAVRTALAVEPLERHGKRIVGLQFSVEVDL